MPAQDDNISQQDGQNIDGASQGVFWGKIRNCSTIIKVFGTFLIVVIIVLSPYLFTDGNISAFLVSFLVGSAFALTLFPLWMGAFPKHLEKKYWAITWFPFFAVAVCCFIWILKAPPLWWFFWPAVLASLVCVVAVFAFVHHIMVIANDHYSNKHRYLLLLLGFSWFIAVALLLGMAVGFHDRAARANAPQGKGEKAIPGLAMLVSEKSVGRWLGKANGGELEPYGPFYIWFDKDSAFVDMHEHAYNDILRKLLDTKKADELKVELTAPPNPGHPRNVNKINGAQKMGIKDVNAKNFAKIVCAIVKCNQDNKGVHLLIKGSASREPTDRYPDNLSLSHTRALQTAEEIFVLVNKHSADNSCALPLLNSVVLGTSYDSERCGRYDKNRDKYDKNHFSPCISARVWIKPYMSEIKYLSPSVEDKPSLLDYMYFSVYTITTTAYGDIVPVTPQAKFVTILANIYEVVFLVIMFNILVAKPSDNGTKIEQAEASSKIIIPGRKT